MYFLYRALYIGIARVSSGRISTLPVLPAHFLARNFSFVTLTPSTTFTSRCERMKGRKSSGREGKSRRKGGEGESPRRRSIASCFTTRQGREGRRINPVRLDRVLVKRRCGDETTNRGDKNPAPERIATGRPLRTDRYLAAAFPRLSSSENPSFQIYFPLERTI